MEWLSGFFSSSHRQGEQVVSAASAISVELNVWEQIKVGLEQKIAPQEYQNWVMRTVFDGIDNGQLRVAVPDLVTKQFIEQEYSEQIRNTIRELNLPVNTIVYLPDAERARSAGASQGHE